MGRGARASLAAVLVVVFAALGGATTGSAKAKPKKRQGTARPNIIVVMTDDMRQDEIFVMKNVKSLIGGQGVTFDNSIASFPLCCPSRATFLTGQYAHNHGVQGNHAPEGGHSKLNHTNTLAVWLQRSGYATIHLGKYLNDYGKPPNSTPTEVPPGWTEWQGGIGLSYSGGTMNLNGSVIRPGKGGGGYATDLYTDRAVEIIRRRGSSARPFFLWVSYYAPHAGDPRESDDPPDIPTPAVAERHRDRYAALAPLRLPSFNAPTPTQSRKLLAPEQIAQIDEARRQRLEALLAVDEGVARIIAAIPAAERANTVVLFTSDNGFYLGERRIPYGKVYPYEEGLRVPLLVRGPGIPKAAHVKALVANVDLAATILQFAKTRPGLPQDGQSLMPFFENPRATPNRAYVIESQVNKFGDPIYVGLRTQRYLYVEYRGSRVPELFDLSVDPYELVSQSKNPAYADVRAQLGSKLQALKACKGAGCAVSSP